jgi:hypothetical protein
LKIDALSSNFREDVIEQKLSEDEPVDPYIYGES